MFYTVLGSSYVIQEMILLLHFIPISLFGICYYSAIQAVLSMIFILSNVTTDVNYHLDLRLKKVFLSLVCNNMIHTSFICKGYFNFLPMNCIHVSKAIFVIEHTKCSLSRFIYGTK